MAKRSTKKETLIVHKKNIMFYSKTIMHKHIAHKSLQDDMHPKQNTLRLC